MNRSSIAVIGGGISGLTAGILLQKRGYDVTIYEKNAYVGGQCFSWTRGAYTFEGSVHWLEGKTEHKLLNNIYKAVGINELIEDIGPTHNVYSFYHLDHKIVLPANTSQMLANLVAVSPQDEDFLVEFIGNIDFLGDMFSSDEYSEDYPAIFATDQMNQLLGVSIEQYFSRCENRIIRQLFFNILPKENTIISLCYRLSRATSGDGGLIRGGGNAIVNKMKTTFLANGGTIKLKHTVESFHITDNQIQKMVTDKGNRRHDFYITAIDPLFSGHEKLVPLQDSAVQIEQKGLSNIFLGFGIDADLSHYPSTMIFANNVFSFSVNNYSKNTFYAPKGKSVLTITILGMSYDNWAKYKKMNVYEQKKQKILTTYTNLLEMYLPEIKGKIEQTTVATPLTYERYCHLNEGSWYMTGGFATVPNMRVKNDEVIKLKNCNFCGFRYNPTGGLPSAFLSAYEATKNV